MTLTAYDSPGNMATCAFTITVEDDESPLTADDCSVYAMAADTDLGEATAAITSLVEAARVAALGDSTDNVGIEIFHAH
eukprot:SAG11_NODE_33740_length_275_cov_1.460227_1_plen_78_part_01